jgi:fucose permease
MTFGVIGLAYASWAARIPQVKAQLGLSASHLGLVLLAMAAGSMVTLPLAGRIVSRWSSRWTVRGGGLVEAVGIWIVAFGARGSVAAVFVGLFVAGLATGLIEVGMNVQGGSVERRIARPIMPRFHASFSIGTVIGAFLGAAMIVTGISVTADLVAIGCLVPLVTWVQSRDYIHDTHDVDPADTETEVRHSHAWFERRTLLVGLVVFAFALAEGTGNDWIGVSMIQGHHTAAALGTIIYGVFLAASTIVRWNGPHILDRWGRVTSLRWLGVIAVLGLLIFTLTPSVPLAFVGAAVWGMGISLGFPVGMSAGSDHPAFAAARVGVIASIGYAAFLGGPPLIGLLAAWLGLPHALWVDIIPLLPAIVIAGAAAPLRAQKSRI